MTRAGACLSIGFLVCAAACSQPSVTATAKAGAASPAPVHEERRAAAAEARFEKCFVRSPIDGTVLKRQREPGESVSVFVPQPIVSIADVTARRVRAEVDERDISRGHEGQRVQVTADAFRDVLEVVVDIDRPDPRLVIGLRVTVSFLK
jgi:multidrug resistance efflux pump